MDKMLPLRVLESYFCGVCMWSTARKWWEMSTMMTTRICFPVMRMRTTTPPMTMMTTARFICTQGDSRSRVENSWQRGLHMRDISSWNGIVIVSEAIRMWWLNRLGMSASKSTRKTNSSERSTISDKQQCGLDISPHLLTRVFAPNYSLVFLFCVHHSRYDFNNLITARIKFVEFFNKWSHSNLNLLWSRLKSTTWTLWVEWRRVDDATTNGRDGHCLMLLEWMLMISYFSLFDSEETRTTDAPNSRTAPLNSTLLNHPFTSLLSPHHSHRTSTLMTSCISLKSHISIDPSSINPFSHLSDTCHVLLIISHHQLSTLIHIINST